MDTKPGWLTAVCVLAIVLGGVGVMMSAFAVVSTIFAPQMQARIQKFSMSFTRPQNQPPGFEATMEKMQAKIVDVQRRWMPANLAAIAANLVLSGCLLLGGLKAMQLVPWGRSLLLWTFGAIILFHLLRLIPNIGMQLATADVMEDFMGEMMQQTATQGKKAIPPAQLRTINNIMSISSKVGMAAGILYMVVIELVQVACYSFGIWYLKKPRVRALYANQAGPAIVEPLA